MSVNDLFDKVWVINLDRHPHKFDSVKKRLDFLGIDFERFSAVDGLKESFDMTGWFSESKKDKQDLEMACRMSHYDVIKTSKDLGLESILILEDDVLFHNNFDNEIKKLNDIKDWKLIYFGASQLNWNLEWFNESFYYSKLSFGTFAYAIHRSAYDSILKELEEGFILEKITGFKKTTIDGTLSLIQLKFYKNCYTFFPNLFVADLKDSSMRINDVEKLISNYKWNPEDYL